MTEQAFTVVASLYTLLFIFILINLAMATIAARQAKKANKAIEDLRKEIMALRGE